MFLTKQIDTIPSQIHVAILYFTEWLPIYGGKYRDKNGILSKICDMHYFRNRNASYSCKISGENMLVGTRMVWIYFILSPNGVAEQKLNRQSSS